MSQQPKRRKLNKSPLAPPAKNSDGKEALTQRLEEVLKTRDACIPVLEQRGSELNLAFEKKAPRWTQWSGAERYTHLLSSGLTVDQLVRVLHLLEPIVRVSNANATPPGSSRRLTNNNNPQGRAAQEEAALSQLLNGQIPCTQVLVDGILGSVDSSHSTGSPPSAPHPQCNQDPVTYRLVAADPPPQGTNSSSVNSNSPPLMMVDPNFLSMLNAYMSSINQTKRSDPVVEKEFIKQVYAAWDSVGKYEAISLSNQIVVERIHSVLPDFGVETKARLLPKYDRLINNHTRRTSMYHFLAAYPDLLPSVREMPDRNAQVLKQLKEFRVTTAKGLFAGLNPPSQTDYAKYDGFLAYLWAMHVCLQTAARAGQGGNNTDTWKSALSTAKSLPEAFDRVKEDLPSLDKEEFLAWLPSPQPQEP